MQINDFLTGQAKAIEHHPTDLEQMVPEVARRLSDQELLGQIPEHQVLGWLRVASSFRLSASEDRRRASIAAAALDVLIRKSPKASSSLNIRAELNWVLDQTLDWLELPLGGDWVRDCLSAAELNKLETYLTGPLKDTSFEREVVLKSIEFQKSTLRAFAVLARLTNFDEKLELLLAAAKGRGEGADAARSALNYIALVEDVVSDDNGLLGLLDDLYVVEWAYAVAEGHTLALPHLTQMLGEWPYVSSPFLMVGGQILDRYSQYVLGSCNQMIRMGGGKVVLRDASSYVTLAAISAGLMGADRPNEEIDEISGWADGQPVFLTARHEKRYRVVYRGRTMLGGKAKIKIEVSGSGTIHLDDWVSKYMFPSPAPHFRLSKGSDVQTWAKDVRSDLLHFLSRSGGHQVGDSAVLLVAPRGKIESHLRSITCRGQPFASVLGASWITQSGAVEPLSGSLANRPQLFACSDAETAKDVLLDPPEGISKWTVVTDGGKLANRLQEMLQSEEINELPILGIVDLAERIDMSEPSLFLVEDHQVVPFAKRVRGFNTTDGLARALIRQSNHWAFKAQVLQFEIPLLDELGEAVTSLREDNEDPMLASLRSGVRRLLIDAGRIPVPSTHLHQSLRSKAGNLSRIADMLGQYDAGANQIASILNHIRSDGLLYPDLLDEVLMGQEDGSESIPTVVVGSRDAAKSTSEKLKEIGILGEAYSVEDAFLAAPFHHVIVPGWFGAFSMRRLMMAPPGRKTTICLSKFQKDWLDSTLRASERRERALENRTFEAIEIADAHLFRGREGPRWPKPARPTAPTIPRSNDVPEVDELPVADLSSLAKKLRPSSGAEQDCLGIPVLLEELGNYCLLPPNGTVFILPSNRTTNASAESELLRPVSALRPGSIFAPIGDEHRDLVDDFADFFLEDASLTRCTANLWRKPFKEALRDNSLVWHKLIERMKESGVRRHEQTFRNWAESRIIAPRDYPMVVPAIAKASLDPELEDRVQEVVSSIESIYKARTEGAEHLLEEVFSGKFDAARMVLETSLLGKDKQIQLHTVSAVGRPIACSRSDHNRIHTDFFQSDSLGGARANS